MKNFKEIWKLIYVLLFIFTLYVIASVFENKEDITYDDIKLSYSESDGLSLYEYIRYEYDSNGNITEENVYKPDGKLYVEKEWEYDKNGNCIKEYYNGGIGTDLETKWEYGYKYKYDSDNRIITETIYKDNKFSCLKNYRHLDNIKASVEYFYNDNGIINLYSKNIYDKDDRKLCSYSYTPSGVVTEYSYIRYDTKDRPVLEVKGKDEENPDKVLVSEYNDAEHIGKVICKEGSEVTKTKLNEYMGNGDIEKELSYRKAEGEDVLEEGYWASYNGDCKIDEMKYDATKEYKLRSYAMNMYDGNHNIVKKVLFEASNVSDNMSRWIFTYKYDESGRIYLIYKEKINQNSISQDYENGCSIKIEFNDDKSLLSVAKNDEQGRCKEKTIFEEDGDIKYREAYLYDGSGSEINVYDIEGNLLYTK